MVNRFSNMMCWLILVTVFVAGCEQEYKSDVDVLAQGPDEETLAVIPNYASGAIEATGGLRAWMEAKKLRVDCVCTFYDSDDSPYITEQCYEIYPWSNSIRISATEPQGQFVWQLSRGGLEGVESWHTGIGFPVELCSKHYFTELILDIATAPVRFLDKPVVFTKSSRPVKIEGLWYYSIERVNPHKTGIWSRAVFYQNRDTSLVDLLWLGDVDGETFLAVRGYDYHEIKKDSVWLPAKIEIFVTDASGTLQRRLVKIELIVDSP